MTDKSNEELVMAAIQSAYIPNTTEFIEEDLSSQMSGTEEEVTRLLSIINQPAQLASVYGRGCQKGVHFNVYTPYGLSKIVCDDVLGDCHQSRTTYILMSGWKMKRGVHVSEFEPKTGLSLNLEGVS